MINVFIVEDDPMVLEVNKGFLAKVDGFKLVGSARTAEEANEKLKDLPVDLVLLDYYLPDRPGVEVLTWMRQENLPADVIMITAARDVSTVKALFRHGVVDYLVKPFRFERFKAALEAYRQMWGKFNREKHLNQEDIDALKRVQAEQTEAVVTNLGQMPKGLSEVTLQRILAVLRNRKEPVKATDVADDLGMARVTVRRYLDFLVQEGKVDMQINYGSIGRPSHYYTLSEKSGSGRPKRSK
ncbi:response regulator receiver and unknown domain protein [Caldalkalibacillus thermarum TA2.A1]|nr:response regulator [Caldalkalibacillus thermarum]EGL83220.1 response regulator receiver and unknown domain protein [Caldalkalibacillus thermarum TA2.A1]